MKVIDQSIPSELWDGYRHGARPATNWINNRYDTFKYARRKYGTGSNIYVVQKRNPHTMGHMRGLWINTPSIEQIKVRRAFRRVCNLFFATHKTIDYMDKWGIGPRPRKEWYYGSWAGVKKWWYFNYFMMLTWRGLYNFEPDRWARTPFFMDTYIASGIMGDPNTNYEQATVLKCGHGFDEETGQDAGFAWALMQATGRAWWRDFSMFRYYIIGGPVDVILSEVEDFNPKTVTWHTRPAVKRNIAKVHIDRDYYEWTNLILQDTWPNFSQTDSLKEGQHPLHWSPIKNLCLRPDVQSWSWNHPIEMPSREWQSKHHGVLCP
jgi:hypothetical protein